MATKMCIIMTAALALLPGHEIERSFEDIKTYDQAKNCSTAKIIYIFLLVKYN